MMRATLSFVLLGALALGGCTRDDPNRIVLAAPPPAAPGAAATALPPPAARPARGTRGRIANNTAPDPAMIDPPPAVPTAPRPGEVYRSPNVTAAQRDQAALIAACRQQAERVILERDRPQLLREDEQAARVGASTSLMDSAFTSDRLGRVYARDRMVEDCVDRNRPAAPRTPTQAPPQ